MEKYILLCNTRVEKELSILIVVGVLIVFTVICLSIVKKIKDK